MINPPNYESATPEPSENVLECGPRWKYDLWYNAIMDLESDKAKLEINRAAMEGGQQGGIGINVRGEYLDQPTMMRATISTAHLLKQYGDIPGIRPFSFITVLPGLSAYEIMTRKRENCGLDDEERPCYDGLKGAAFYAPFTNRFDDIQNSIRRNNTGELVKSLKHKTLLERLAGYFRRNKSNSYPSDDTGCSRINTSTWSNTSTSRRSPETSRKRCWVMSSGITQIATREYSRTGVAELVATVGAAALARRTGVPRRTLNDIKHGARTEWWALGPAGVARESKVGRRTIYDMLNGVK
jgi:hypothetical protein